MVFDISMPPTTKETKKKLLKESEEYKSIWRYTLSSKIGRLDNIKMAIHPPNHNSDPTRFLWKLVS